MVNTVKASAVAVDIATLKANEAKDKAAALKAANDRIAQENSAAKLDTGAKAVPTLKEARCTRLHAAPADRGRAL